MNTLSTSVNYGNPFYADNFNSIKGDADFVIAASNATRSNKLLSDTPQTLFTRLVIAQTRLNEEKKTLLTQIQNRPEHRPQIEAMIARGEAEVQKMREQYTEIIGQSAELVGQSISSQTEIAKSTYFEPMSTGNMSLASAGMLLKSFQA